MTAEERGGSAGDGWLSSPLARWLFGVFGVYADVLGVVLGKLPTLFKLPRALRSLPDGARIIAIACLVLLALLVAATHVLHDAPFRLASLTWTQDGQSFALPRVALYLSLIGWAMSAAMILAGASQRNLALLVAAGLLQLFAIVFIGFAGGKAYALAAASWLLPVCAATSPAVRRGRVAGIVALCALATWHTHLFTPLSAQGRPPRWGWLLALFAVSVPVLLRLPRRLNLGGAFALSLAVSAGILVPALGAGELGMARGLVIPTSFFVGLFAVMWFALGAEFVAGAVSAANAAIKVASRAIRRRWLPALVIALCLAEVAAAPWLLDRLSVTDAAALSLHRWLALALGLAGLALALRRSAADWTRAVLVIWMFTLVALRSYFSDVTELAGYADPGELKRLALTLFTFAMAMQIVRLLIDETGRTSQARLFLQLGALTLLATGTQFEFAIANTEVMKEAATYQFAGATALFLPLLLALLVREQRWLPAPAPGRLARGFLVGFGAAFAMQLVRIATHGPGGWGLAGHLGAVAVGDAVKALCIAGLIVIGRAAGRIDGPTVAVACALGFAAGHAQNLAVLMLDSSVKMLLLLTVPSAVVSERLSALVAGYVRMRPALPAADHYHLFVASLWPAAIMGWAIAAGARDRRPVRGALGALAGLAVSLAFAWVLHVHPVFMTESRDPVPFYVVLTDAYALAPLLAALAGLVLWGYAVVWRPARRAAAQSPTVDVATPPRRPWATAAATVAPVVVLGALGLGLAARAPSPLQGYEDPQRRFTIDVPRDWRVERRAGGETVFYRDDPVHGTLVIVHPGIPLPGAVSAEQLVAALERQLRTVYPDVRVTADPSPARAEGDRSTQRIEVAATWTGPGQRRLRARSTIVLATSGQASRFSYATYQVVEPAAPALESLLARATRSYRAAGPG